VSLAAFVVYLMASVTQNGAEDECLEDIGGKAEGKRLLRRQRRRWVDNIKINLREMGWYGLDRSGSG
jgi:hypothetical protein